MFWKRQQYSTHQKLRKIRRQQHPLIHRRSLQSESWELGPCPIFGLEDVADIPRLKNNGYENTIFVGVIALTCPLVTGAPHPGSDVTKRRNKVRGRRCPGVHGRSASAWRSKVWSTSPGWDIVRNWLGTCFEEVSQGAVVSYIADW